MRRLRVGRWNSAQEGCNCQWKLFARNFNMAAKSATKLLYEGVMDDVYAKMRLAIDREGLDESVLDQLHEVCLAPLCCVPAAAQTCTL